MAVLVFGGQAAVGQGDEAGPPASRIHDVVDLFDRDHEAFATISARLRDFEARHGFSIYLAVYSGLMYDDAGAQGRELFNRWVGDGRNGVIVLYDADARLAKLTFPMAGGAPDAGMESGGPARHRFETIAGELAGLEAGGESASDYLDRFTAVLVARLEAVLAEEEQSGVSGWKFAIVVVAIGSVVAGIGFFVQSLFRDSESRARQQHYFPEVEIETRLGAPHGGARVNVLSYQSQPARGKGRS